MDIRTKGAVLRHVLSLKGGTPPDFWSRGGTPLGFDFKGGTPPDRWCK